MYTRIKQILDDSGLNQQEFAERIAIAPATLSNILKGKVAKYSTDLVMSIVAAYPTINLNWLMSGQGEMYSANQAGAAEGSNPAEGVGINAGDGQGANGFGYQPGAEGTMFDQLSEDVFSAGATFAYNSPTPNNGLEMQTGRKAVSSGVANGGRANPAQGAARGTLNAAFVPGLAHANGSPVTFEDFGKIVSHFSAMNYPGNPAFQAVKMQDKQPRKIKEIRIFYDDDTFEVFSPNKE